MYSRQEQRKDIKSLMNYDNCRRVRSDRSLGLRKKRKEEHLRKRRKECVAGKYDVNVQDKLKKLPELAADMRSNDPQKQLVATIFIRHLLAMETTPPIDEVVNVGLVPVLVSFLTRDDQPQLQFEACWAITNICSGSEYHTNFVLKCNAVPTLIKLLESNNEQVREQTVWALGNISGDSARVRNYCLECNILPPLFKVIEKRPNVQTLRTAVWCLSNLCRGKPLVDYSVVLRTLPLLSYLIYNTDLECLTDAVWAVSYISDGPNNRIQCVLENNLVKRLVELLTHYNATIQTPALRTIGNIVTGNDTQTQAVISCGGIEALKKLLDHNKKSIRKETVWTLSNICAGSQSQLQLVMDSGCFKNIIGFLESEDFEIRRESTWSITNALMTGNLSQVQYLVSNGVCKPLCNILGLEDTQIVLVALDGIHALLERGRVLGRENGGENIYCMFIEKSGGVDKMEDLQDHKNEEVYQKAFKILKTYFELDDDDDEVQQDENFSFNNQVTYQNNNNNGQGRMNN